MNKDLVYNNIVEMINNGVFTKKYCELTKNINLDPTDENYDFTLNQLENISASIFNAILIGCQLFDDQERILRFVDEFSLSLDSFTLSYRLEDYGITQEEACERLKHGFGVHFTTTKICDEIKKSGELSSYGNNSMFTDEEDKIITNASRKQRENDPDAERTMNYLYRGFGTGVSSYSSMTNGFWMYHTPESLSFIFGNISSRDKSRAMKFVSEKLSSLTEEEQKETLTALENIYDRLVGEEQEVGCILIDRDAFKYEVDYYYNTGEPVAVERRPYKNGLNSLESNDNKITNSINCNNLKFLKIPTVLKLEQIKKAQQIKKI